MNFHTASAALPKHWPFTEPTQVQLDAFIERAGFKHGWQNLESQARRMAERAVSENTVIADELTNTRTALRYLLQQCTTGTSGGKAALPEDNAAVINAVKVLGL